MAFDSLIPSRLSKMIPSSFTDFSLAVSPYKLTVLADSIVHIFNQCYNNIQKIYTICISHCTCWFCCRLPIAFDLVFSKKVIRFFILEAIRNQVSLIRLKFSCHSLRLPCSPGCLFSSLCRGHSVHSSTHLQRCESVCREGVASIPKQLLPTLVQVEAEVHKVSVQRTATQTIQPLPQCNHHHP